ncbi:uncharacterized protein [Watersipora subatra]|uniref:uncharacterized protein n=1 Tax=Watersipora subatra TaxID=2589382 RepID=UPI00355BE9B7
MTAGNEDDELNLNVFSKRPTISGVEKDLNYLTALYESGLCKDLITKHFSKLQNALRIVVKSPLLRYPSMLNCERDQHIFNVQRFTSLLLTIIDPSKLESGLVTETLDYILRDRQFETNSIYRDRRRAAFFSASYHCGVLYHALESDRVKLRQWNLVRAFHDCLDAGRMNGARNLLYVIAAMPPCTLAHITSRSISQNLLPIAFAMIEMGVFCYHQDCVADERPKDEMFDELVFKIKEQPKSLQQLARLTIRSCMKDGDVVRGSYSLPILVSLQDYVSLKFLDATITHMYFPDSIPTGYDVTHDINRTYGTEFSSASTSSETATEWRWKLQNDLP